MGTVLTLKCSPNGSPLDRYWRNRLRDSAVDGCIEPVGTTKKTTKSPKTSKVKAIDTEG